MALIAVALGRGSNQAEAAISQKAWSQMKLSIGFGHARLDKPAIVSGRLLVRMKVEVVHLQDY